MNALLFHPQHECFVGKVLAHFPDNMVVHFPPAPVGLHASVWLHCDEHRAHMWPKADLIHHSLEDFEELISADICRYHHLCLQAVLQVHEVFLRCWPCEHCNLTSLLRFCHLQHVVFFRLRFKGDMASSSHCLSPTRGSKSRTVEAIGR